eukprot:TRINITY_DN12350_c0_g1_i4.p1 TRINITY_DN12350_c0_g1~~TRINITY_DN12350_c0_g1_i4.p1  ORF type:complete len:559 (-),score=99.12 TRINITY_DN12350_c0_g1_i4:375-2051(-)
MAERFSGEKGIRGFIMRLIRMKKDSSELFVIQRNLEQILVVVDTTLGLETKADVQRLLKFQENLGNNMKQLSSTVDELGGMDKLSQWTDDQFQTVLKLMEPQQALQFSLLQEITETMREGPHSLIENELIREFWKNVAGNRFQMEYDEFWSALKQYYSQDPEVVSLISDEVYRSQFQSALDDGLDFRYITVTELNDAFKASAPIGVKEVLYWLLGKAVVMRDRSDVAAFTNCIEFLGEGKYRLRGTCDGDAFQKLLDFVPAGTEIDLASYRVNCCGDLNIKKGVTIKGNKGVIVCDQQGITIYRTKVPVKFAGVKFTVGKGVSRMDSMLRVLEGANLHLENCVIQGTYPNVFNQQFNQFIGIKTEQWSKLNVSNSTVRQYQAGISSEGQCELKSMRIEHCAVAFIQKQEDSKSFLSNVLIGKDVQKGLVITEGNAQLNSVNVKVLNKNTSIRTNRLEILPVEPVVSNQTTGIQVIHGGKIKFEGEGGESNISGGEFGIYIKENSEVQVLQNLNIKDCSSGIYVMDYSELKEMQGKVVFYENCGRKIELKNNGTHKVFE